MKTLLSTIIALLFVTSANAQYVTTSTNDHNDYVTITVTINNDQVTGNETYGKFTFENGLEIVALGTHVYKNENGVVNITFHTKNRKVVTVFETLAIRTISLAGRPVAF